MTKAETTFMVILTEKLKATVLEIQEKVNTSAVVVIERARKFKQKERFSSKIGCDVTWGHLRSK